MRNKLYCEAKRAFLSNFFSNSKHALLDILLVPWGRILSGMRKKGGIAFKIACSELICWRGKLDFLLQDMEPTWPPWPTRPSPLPATATSPSTMQLPSVQRALQRGLQRYSIYGRTSAPIGALKCNFPPWQLWQKDSNDRPTNQRSDMRLYREVILRISQTPVNNSQCLRNRICYLTFSNCAKENKLYRGFQQIAA